MKVYEDMKRSIPHAPVSRLAVLSAAVLTIAVVLLLAACDFSGLFGKAESATGSLSLSLDTSVRGTFYPWNPSSPSLPIASYTVQGSGPYGASFSQNVSAPAANVVVGDLVVGTWNIEVSAKNASGDAIAYGTTSVGVAKDVTNSAAVTLAPSASGTGGMEIEVAWPSSEFTYPNVTGSYKIDGGTETPITWTVGETSATASLSGLTAGSYTLSISIAYNGVERTRIIATAHIYANLNTPVAINLLDADIISPPEAPGYYNGDMALSKEAVSGTSVRFRWADNSLYDTGYDAEIDNDGVFFIPATTTEYLAKNLSPVPAHAFRIRAKNKAGSSAWLTVSGAYTLRGSAELNFTTNLPLPSDHDVALQGMAASVAAGTNLAVLAVIDGTPPLTVDHDLNWYVDGVLFAQTTRDLLLVGATLPLGKHELVCAAQLGSRQYSAAALFTVEPSIGSAASGANHSLFIDGFGKAWAVGFNEVYGQCGSSGLDRTRPGTFGVNDAAAVAAGAETSFLIRRDGNLYVFGRNDSGQLGDGTGTTRDTPTYAISLAAAVAARGNTAFVLLRDGKLYAMGDNSFGQYGDGTTTSTLSMAYVMPDIVAVATGGSHSLAIRADGQLLAFGRNDVYQLGDGTTTPSSTPIPIYPGQDFAAVAAGDDYSLALDVDGNLYAFGGNVYGNLGVAASSSNAGVLVVSGGVRAIAAGGNSSYLIKTDDTLWACGNNVAGQLGDGTYNQSDAFKQIVAGVASIHAGPTCAMAVFNDGSVRSWGANVGGQLGLGNYAVHTAPSEIYFDGSDPNCDNVLVISAVTPRSYTISWTAATDDATEQAALAYQVVTAASRDAIGTLAAVAAVSGEGVYQPWTANLTSIVVKHSWISPPAVAVLVRDLAGRMSLYQSVYPTGFITTIAGTGAADFSGDYGKAEYAALNAPRGIAAIPGNGLVIADSGNNRVREIGPDGIIRTVAGTGAAGFAGDGQNAVVMGQLNNPTDVAWNLDTDDAIYVSDTGNNRIRAINYTTRTITTLAGSGTPGFNGDPVDPATAVDVQLNQPSYISFYSSTVVVSDSGNHCVRFVGTDGINLLTVIGIGGSPGYNGDGDMAVVQLNEPSGVYINSGGFILFNDRGNGLFRALLPPDVMTVSGTAGTGFAGDGEMAEFGQFSVDGLWGISGDFSNNLFVADRGNYRVRRMNYDGMLSTVAGNGGNGYSGDGGLAVNATFAGLRDVEVDAAGRLFITDDVKHCIRMVYGTEDGFGTGYSP